jgi:16S rRNA (cytosine967-C5)-methyltransferase
VVSSEKPREIAARVLGRRPGGEYVEEAFEETVARTALSPADRRLCQELVYGVVRWCATLDWLIDAKTASRPQKPVLQNLLRLGLFQIFWLDRIPNHAAVHETVELAKQAGLHSQAGFVNAVLRGYVREFDTTQEKLELLKRSDPALGYSHPKWLVDRWHRRWGEEKTNRLMEWNNTPPATFARVNTLKIDPGKLLSQWREENVDYDFVHLDWVQENLVFQLKSHPPLSRLPSFTQGSFYVQDPSTLLAVQELNPKQGETILDLCAAPGGKLTYAAQLMGDKGRLIAHDLTPARLKLIKENCARLGVTCAELLPPSALHSNSPGAKPERSVREPLEQHCCYNRVLVDAPCSNTGVMRRRVDLRWRIEPKEIDRLAAIQQGLLQQAAGLLKPGGTLVYSTCSLEPEENERVLSEFLKQRPEFKLESQRELLPFVEAVDGAFVARLRSRGGLTSP